MATRAEAVRRRETAYDELREADEGMLLFVQGYVWKTIVLQAKAEGISPGDVLNRALRMYLEDRGGSEAVEYLRSLAGR